MKAERQGTIMYFFEDDASKELRWLSHCARYLTKKLKN
jgi:hypothetical protein